MCYQIESKLTLVRYVYVKLFLAKTADRPAGSGELLASGYVLPDSRSVKNHATETSSDGPFTNAITPDEDRAVKNHAFLFEDGIHPGRNKAENNHTSLRTTYPPAGDRVENEHAGSLPVDENMNLADADMTQSRRSEDENNNLADADMNQMSRRSEDEYYVTDARPKHSLCPIAQATQDRNFAEIKQTEDSFYDVDERTSDRTFRRKYSIEDSSVDECTLEFPDGSCSGIGHPGNFSVEHNSGRSTTENFPVKLEVCTVPAPLEVSRRAAGDVPFTKNNPI